MENAPTNEKTRCQQYTKWLQHQSRQARTIRGSFPRSLEIRNSPIIIKRDPHHPRTLNTHMGRLLCPKPSLFNYFVRIPSFPGKLQVAPVTSLYIPCVTPDAPPWRPLCLRSGTVLIRPAARNTMVRPTSLWHQTCSWAASCGTSVKAEALLRTRDHDTQTQKIKCISFFS